MNVKSDRFIAVLAWPIMLTLLVMIISQSNAQTITPVPLPDPKIPGFTYPTPSNTIVLWTINDDQNEINKHAWGIWTALTTETDQYYNGHKLRVFETWLTPEDVFFEGRRTVRPFESPRQLSHGGSGVPDMETIGVHTKYDPTLSRHIRVNDLLSTIQLRFLLMTGVTKVREFPPTAMAIKPVFKAIPSTELVDRRYYQIAAWPGPPSATMDPLPGTAEAFPSDSWGQCIWIDVTNQSRKIGDSYVPSAKEPPVDKTCDPSGSSRKPSNTYNVNNFINFRLSDEEANFANEQRRNEQKLQGQPAPSLLKAGDYAVLVGMHVSSRETTRWTWQTFWWELNPDKPHFPSSEIIAKARPAQLKGAARNYAVAASYSMLNPPQPYSFGKNVGSSVYAYNPWLEAGFGPSDLPDSIPGTYEGRPVPNNVGIQTNCMSCHAQANYNLYSIGVGDPPAYTGARYVDMSSPRFNGRLQVDFLWSIPNMAKPRKTKTEMAK